MTACMILSHSSYFFGTDTPKEYADNFVYIPTQQRINDVSQTEWTSIHWETSSQANGSSLLNFISSTPTDASGGLAIVNVGAQLGRRFALRPQRTQPDVRVRVDMHRGAEVLTEGMG